MAADYDGACSFVDDHSSGDIGFNGQVFRLGDEIHGGVKRDHISRHFSFDGTRIQGDRQRLFESGVQCLGDAGGGGEIGISQEECNFAVVLHL